MAEAEVQIETPQSEVLSSEEVAQVVSEEPKASEEVILPSDQESFQIPDKFKDKSAEEIARAYVELEKMKSKPQEEQSQEVEGGGEESTKEESTKEEHYNKYVESYEKNGELSEAEYKELSDLGYDKATVDAEIKRREEYSEFQKYKQEKALNDVLEPLGGGTEKFKEVAEWAAKAKPADEVKAFNEALAGAPKLAQQALLKQLYSEYDAASDTIDDTMLHTNSPQTMPSKGYSTQEEFFKDVSSPEYTNNPKFREAVEKKMSLSDIF